MNRFIQLNKWYRVHMVLPPIEGARLVLQRNGYLKVIPEDDSITLNVYRQPDHFLRRKLSLLHRKYRRKVSRRMGK